MRIEMIVPFPADEAARLRTLHRYRLLDTPPEERFDRITRLARRLFDTPISLLSLIDRDRQWFKSAQGLSVQETPRDVAFCAHAILSDEVMAVADASQDPRFYSNRLVVDEPGIRFYAAAPLLTVEGHALGTLCVIDRKARTFSGTDKRDLADLATLAMREIEWHASQDKRQLFHDLANHDATTGTYTREAVERILDIRAAEAERFGQPLAVCVVRIEARSDTHERLDEGAHIALLRSFVALCRENLREDDIIGRFRDEEFALVLPNVDMVRALHAIERIRVRVRERPVRTEAGSLPFSISCGVTERKSTEMGAVMLRRAGEAATKAASADGNRAEVA